MMIKILFLLIAFIFPLSAAQAAVIQDPAYYHFVRTYGYQSTAYPILLTLCDSFKHSTSTATDAQKKAVCTLLVEEMTRIKTFVEGKTFPSSWFLWMNNVDAAGDARLRAAWANNLDFHTTTLSAFTSATALSGQAIVPLDEKTLADFIASHFPEKSSTEVNALAHSLITSSPVMTALPRSSFECNDAAFNRLGAYAWSGATLIALSLSIKALHDDYKVYGAEWEELSDEEQRFTPKKGFATFVIARFFSLKPFDDARFLQLSALAFALLAAYDYKRS